MYSDMQCQQWDTDDDSASLKDNVKSSDKVINATSNGINNRRNMKTNI